MSVTLMDCILEQPDVMKTVIEKLPGEVEKALGAFDRSFGRIYLVGSGSSYNAAVAAKGVMERFGDADVQVVPAFEFNHYVPGSKLTDRTLVVGITQTSRSTGTLNALKRAATQGAGTILVTAEPFRAAPDAADAILDTWTGLEPVGPKSKGYTSTIASLIFLAAGLNKKQIDFGPVAAFMAEIVKRTEQAMPKFIEAFGPASSLKVISYGPNMATALEGGLKVLETVRIPVEIYNVEEYMHGPYHCLESDTYMIIIAPPGPGQKRAIDLLQFARTITAHTLFITDDACPVEENAGTVIKLPGGIEEILTPLGYIIPLQWYASEMTRQLGRQPELSRHPQFHATLGSKFVPR
ncbi:SIS domain-containing protein [Paenibacillaceae bacterium WGS1546]|uniref:SIS domain-containing protein n=1 Tax=Cohnella sp. WGS1546 TaxID=3366810 RepID=UPI00372D0139